MQIWYKNGFVGLLKSYPGLCDNRNFSPIPQVCIHTKHYHSTILFEKLFENLVQKRFCWAFEVLPPGYVTINENFSPVR